MDSTKTCSIEGCQKTVWAVGMCRSHRERFRVYGDPLAGRPSPTGKPGGPCAVQGCENLSICRGLCDMHYTRRKRHGDPLVKHLTGKPNAVEPGFVKGYRRFQSKGRREMEHRLIAETKIGRAIRRDEVVHHINGDTLDNRPENLEVMLRSEHQSMHHRQTHCKKGHALTEDNVMLWADGHLVLRRCKACFREYRQGVPYYGVGWKAARRAALERDGYCCQECGRGEDAGVALEVHHIIPALSFGAERWREANELGNLVTLCRECHLNLTNPTVRRTRA